MAWETREHGRRYYTRSSRRGGHVVREYVGGGSAGEHAAATDLARRVARRTARDASREAWQRIVELDDHVMTLCDAAETAAMAALLVAGFHRHARGEWRRRHG